MFYIPSAMAIIAFHYADIDIRYAYFFLPVRMSVKVDFNILFSIFK